MQNDFHDNALFHQSPELSFRRVVKVGLGVNFRVRSVVDR